MKLRNRVVPSIAAIVAVAIISTFGITSCAKTSTMKTGSAAAQLKTAALQMEASGDSSSSYSSTASSVSNTSSAVSSGSATSSQAASSQAEQSSAPASSSSQATSSQAASPSAPASSSSSIGTKVYNLNTSVSARGATITFTKCTAGDNGFRIACSFQYNSEDMFFFSKQGMSMKAVDGTNIPFELDSIQGPVTHGTDKTADWVTATYPGANTVQKIFFTCDFKNYNPSANDSTTDPQTIEIDLH